MKYLFLFILSVTLPFNTIVAQPLQPTPTGDWEIKTDPDVTALAIDSSGNLFALNSKPPCVTKYSADGKVLSRWKPSVCQKAGLIQPRGMAIDSKDHIYIADPGSPKIKIFNEAGQMLGSFSVIPDSEAINPGKHLPGLTSVYLDDLDNLYIYQGFKKLSKYAPDQTLVFSLDLFQGNNWDADFPTCLPEVCWQRRWEFPLSVDPEGHVFIRKEKVYEYDPAGKFLGFADTLHGKLLMDYRVSDKNGNYYFNGGSRIDRKKINLSDDRPAIALGKAGQIPTYKWDKFKVVQTQKNILSLVKNFLKDPKFSENEETGVKHNPYWEELARCGITPDLQYGKYAFDYKPFPGTPYSMLFVYFNSFLLNENKPTEVIRIVEEGDQRNMDNAVEKVNDGRLRVFLGGYGSNGCEASNYESGVIDIDLKNKKIGSLGIWGHSFFRDINHDGKLELFVSDADGCKCADFYRIFAWKDQAWSDVSAEYPDFYKNEMTEDLFMPSEDQNKSCEDDEDDFFAASLLGGPKK